MIAEKRAGTNRKLLLETANYSKITKKNPEQGWKAAEG
jgi:hypothetical protein